MSKPFVSFHINIFPLLRTPSMVTLSLTFSSRVFFPCVCFTTSRRYSEENCLSRKLKFFFFIVIMQKRCVEAKFRKTYLLYEIVIIFKLFFDFFVYNTHLDSYCRDYHIVMVTALTGSYPPAVIESSATTGLLAVAYGVRS